jgi:Sulfotransferase family
MYISDKYKTVFIFPESTASRSISKWFTDNYEAFEAIGKHGFDLNVIAQHWGQEYTDQLKTYTICMTVRHPFRRMLSMFLRLSAWKNHNDGHGLLWESFDEWLDYLIVGSKIKTAYGARNEWVYFDDLERNFFRPVKQSEIYQDVVNDFGRVDYLIHQEFPVFDLKQLPFIKENVELPNIGVSNINLKKYDRIDYRNKMYEYCPEEYDLFGYAK